MKKYAVALAVLMMTGGAQAVELKTDQQRFSYILGLQIGKQLQSEGIKIEYNAFTQALKDTASGASSKLSNEEIQETMMRVQQQQMQKAQKAGDANKAEGEEFLAANKNKAGVKTTASGLQYKVIKAGSGRAPKATDTVEVHYRGTLINGDEFDSSYSRGQPATFPVNGVIKGWQEALQLMKEGAKWQVYVPSNLAYDQRGAGGKIGPNATLIFDVELLKIK